jgi:hypothetical protein
METAQVSGTQGAQDAKQRLALSMVLSKFAPTLISEPSVEAPYGRDHHGNPRTRQAQEQEEGRSPFDGGVVGGESISEAVGMNLHRLQQSDAIQRLFGGPNAPTITPRLG